jgi:hypothetical protein
VYFAKQASYVTNFGLYNPYIIYNFIQDPSTQYVFNCLTKMTKKNIRTSPNLSMFNPYNINDRVRIIGFATGALSIIVNVASASASQTK